MEENIGYFLLQNFNLKDVKSSMEIVTEFYW